MGGAGRVAETALGWESAPRVLTLALLVSGFEILGKSNGNMEMNPRKKKAGQERSWGGRKGRRGTRQRHSASWEERGPSTAGAP